jgi:hypothetical protein
MTNKLYDICTTVFYLEGWLLVATGIFMTFFPAMTIQMFGIDVPADSEKLAGYFLQQFSVMCILMGYVGVRSHPTVPRTTLEACLLADFLYVAVFMPCIQTYGRWTPGSIFSVGITLFLASVRIVHLTFNKQKIK